MRRVAAILLIWTTAGLSLFARQQQVPCSAALANEAMASGWNLDFGPGIYRSCDPGVTPAKPTNNVKPDYTAKAMLAKIQGPVLIGAVVDADGRVREARILKSLDAALGLDANAIKALKATKFKPAQLAGRPVRSFVIIEMSFNCCGGT